MKIPFPPTDSRRSGFTMVEIALCLAIVGFALVAIIGVLPAGLNVQRENREETVINQDSTVWLDAIRTGAQGYDELTNYVDRIVISNLIYDVNGVLQQQRLGVLAQHRAGGGVTPDVYLDNGWKVVGLLSLPKYMPITSGPLIGGYTNNVVYAYCRAISGVSTEKTPSQHNEEVRANAFAYRMAVEVTQPGDFDPDRVSTNNTGVALRQNLTDVRLLVRWPLRQPLDQDRAENPPVADTSRMIFRTQASGRMVMSQPTPPGIPYYFIRPHEYQ